MSGKCEKVYCAGIASHKVKTKCQGEHHTPGIYDELYHCRNCAHLEFCVTCNECGDPYCLGCIGAFPSIECKNSGRDTSMRRVCPFCALKKHGCVHVDCAAYIPKLADAAKKMRNNAVQFLCNDMDEQISKTKQNARIVYME